MHPMHIAGIDLNLAVVLHALLEERSVSRAAKRVGLSQSATSHALSRLRDVLKDPLFVRTSTGLVPTARATAMAESVANAIGALERSFFVAPHFDPKTTERTFKIGTTDYAESVVFPALLGRLADAAPNVDVWVKPMPSEADAALASGELDLTMAPIRSGDGLEGMRSLGLWHDRFVGVARRGHPITRGKVTLDRFVKAKHAFIAPRGRPGGVVDDALSKLGLSRRVAYTTPNFLVAPDVVSRTDLVITLASRVATAFVGTSPLALFDVPLELAEFHVAMFWHERHHTDPAHRFLREELAKTARALPPLAPPAKISGRRTPERPARSGR